MKSLAAYTPAELQPPFINFSLTEAGLIRVTVRSPDGGPTAHIDLEKNRAFDLFAEVLASC